MYEYQNLLPKNFDRVADNLFASRYCTPVLLRLLSENDSDPARQKSEVGVSFLHPKELLLYSSYKLSKRRSEYLTGRICAKMAIQKYFLSQNCTVAQLEPNELEISPAENGRPTIAFTNTPKEPTPKISISHSGKYAIAAASRGHCGIDIQYPSNTLLRVQEKYCTSNENLFLQRSLPSHELITRLTILWAAKEAVQKTCSQNKMPGFLDIELRELERTSTGNATLCMAVRDQEGSPCRRTYNVATTLLKGYAVALCIEGIRSNA